MVFWIFALLCFPVLLPQPVSAHAFGQLYNLPVPFWLYLWGGAAVIITSFLIIGYFFNNTHKVDSYPVKDLSRFKIVKALTSNVFFLILKSIGIFFYLLTLFSGFIGVDNPRLNFNMTFFWIFFVLGLAYSTAVFGNIWAIVNPWKNLIEIFEKLFGKKIEGFVSYPKFFGYYPAFTFYFLFIWTELMGETGPHSLSMILLVYSIITFAGVLIFGKKAWFEYGEFFSVFFRLISKIAPFEFNNQKLYLRAPLVGLIKKSTSKFSLMLFIIFMLSSTAFDGFQSTAPWFRIKTTLLEPVVGLIFGPNTFLTMQAVKTAGLLLTLLIFLSVYLYLAILAKIISKSKLSFVEIALKFAFSHIPLAFAYNIAHYYTLIQTEGQNMVRLISDPFGFGWNIFGTATFKPNYSVINANFAWHSQVAIIIIGHVAGVYIAHVIALKVFHSRQGAFASQLPMLILMVLYTMAGLWILSQPITSG